MYTHTQPRMGCKITQHLRHPWMTTYRGVLVSEPSFRDPITPSSMWWLLRLIVHRYIDHCTGTNCNRSGYRQYRPSKVRMTCGGDLGIMWSLFQYTETNRLFSRIATQDKSDYQFSDIEIGIGIRALQISQWTYLHRLRYQHGHKRSPHKYYIPSIW